MSDVHVRYMLARLELRGSKMLVLGDEGPRSCPTKFWWAAGACRYCGGPINAGCGGKCAVRAIEQRTTADDPDPGDPPQEES